MARLFNYAIEWSFGLKALLLYVVAFVFVIAIMVLILELSSKKEEYISTKDKIRRSLKYSRKPTEYIQIINEKETSEQVCLHEEKIVRVFAYRKAKSKYMPITYLSTKSVIENSNGAEDCNELKEEVKVCNEKVEEESSIVLSLPKKQQEEVVLSLPKKEKEEIVLSLQKKTNDEVTLSLPKKKKTNNKDIITTIVILLCVFILSALSPSIAKYFTEQSNNPNAQLAEFIEIDKDEVVSAIDLNDIVIDPSSETVNRKFKVHNNGETAIKCKFVITTTGNLPLIYSWSVVDQAGSSTSLEFEKIMQVNEQLIYNLSIVWDSTNKSYVYSTELDYISITLYCEQYSGGE